MVRNVTGPWITYLPKISTIHTQSQCHLSLKSSWTRAQICLKTFRSLKFSILKNWAIKLWNPFEQIVPKSNEFLRSRPLRKVEQQWTQTEFRNWKVAKPIDYLRGMRAAAGVDPLRFASYNWRSENPSTLMNKIKENFNREGRQLSLRNLVDKFISGESSKIWWELWI